MNDWLREGLESTKTTEYSHFAALFYQATAAPYVKAQEKLHAFLDADPDKQSVKIKDAIQIILKIGTVDDPSLSTAGYLDWLKEQVGDEP